MTRDEILARYRQLRAISIDHHRAALDDGMMEEDVEFE